MRSPWTRSSDRAWTTDAERREQWNHLKEQARRFDLSTSRTPYWVKEQGRDVIVRVRWKTRRYTFRVRVFNRHYTPVNMWIPEYKRVLDLRIRRLRLHRPQYGKKRGRSYVAWWLRGRDRTLRIPPVVYNAIARIMLRTYWRAS